MEGIKENYIALLIEKYEKDGKVRSYSSKECNDIRKVIDDKMRQVRSDVRRLDFASKASGEKIIVSGHAINL
jgi:hypothetical protein